MRKQKRKNELKLFGQIAISIHRARRVDVFCTSFRDGEPDLEKQLERCIKNFRHRLDIEEQERIIHQQRIQYFLENIPHSQFLILLKSMIRYHSRYRIANLFVKRQEHRMLFSRYHHMFLDCLYTIPYEHCKKDLTFTRNQVDQFVLAWTKKKELFDKMKVDSGNLVLNEYDEQSFQIEKLLSLGTAYVSIFVKASFIVDFIDWNLEGWLAQMEEADLNQFLHELLAYPNPEQKILPDGLKFTGLSVFIKLLFRFYKTLDY